MAEKILVWGVIIIFALLLIGSTLYFLFFAFSLLAEVKGFSALLVIGATIYGLLAIWVNVKNMLS